MNYLYLIRGLPNSGKTTVGNVLAPQHCYAADDFYYRLAHEQNKKYIDVWSPSLSKKAHDYCYQNVLDAMHEDAGYIAVCNTFTKKEEMDRYINLASQFGYQVSILIVEKNHNGDNNHGVSSSTIAKMVNNFEWYDPRMSLEVA